MAGSRATGARASVPDTAPGDRPPARPEQANRANSPHRRAPCCHNPTGADLEPAARRAVGDLAARRGLIPLVDLAYQGLGDGLDEDAAGVRELLACVPEALVAVSCSKSFGLYRERTGLLLAQTGGRGDSGRVRASLAALARLIYSNPPDHGAAIVRTILGDPALRADWLAELTTMRARVSRIRADLAARAGNGRLASVARGRGLFALLPIAPEDVLRLRREQALYMPENGRINLAGLVGDGIDRLVAAIGD